MKVGFSPELSPKEMLELGVFGGWYFGNDIDEYPKSWFKKAKMSENGFDVELNYFKIKSGISILADFWLDVTRFNRSVPMLSV